MQLVLSVTCLFTLVDEPVPQPLQLLVLESTKE